MEQTQSDAKKKPADEAQAAASARPKFWRRTPVIVAGTLLFAALLFLGLHYLGETITHEATDNAFLEGDVVSIAPKIPGHVKKVYVDQNQPVKAGDLLLELDPRDYEMLVAQKKSALEAVRGNELVVKASFELLARQVDSAEAVVKQTEAEATADQAQADKASADLLRAEDLSRRNIISPQEFDAAKTAAAAAVATANAGKEKIASERAKVAAAKAQLEAGRRALERSQAQSEESHVDVEQAELNLTYARMTSPQDGRVTRKAVEEGDYVQVGQKLMALVLNRLWVTANFKETQLRRIRVGQPVGITIDSVAGRVFSGKVQSIQSGSGAAFSLLPPENAVGNYVKVVQRVPVRIFFDEPLDTEHVLGPGMSVSPSVHVTSYEISHVLLGAIAILLALAAGYLWRRAALRSSNPS